MAEPKRKRWRTLTAKPGELKAAYGRDEGGTVDVCFAWGPGCDKADARLLYSTLSYERPASPLRPDEPGISFLDEIERRGYDLKTLKITIQKAAPTSPPGER
jgi:hypothetical protein